MPGTVGNNLGLKWGYVDGETGWGQDSYNAGFALLDAVVGLAVLSRALTAPPGSPTRGQRYIPLATATGTWATHENQIAWYDGAAWQFITPKTGWRAWDVNTSAFVYYTGSAWAAEPFATAASVATAVGTETTRATAAEGANATAISTETTNRIAADSTNATAIGAETTRATAAELANTALARSNVGRNYVHNGRMRIQQRGTGVFSTSGAMTLDRWQIAFVNGSLSVQPSTYSDAQRAAIGDESVNNCLVAVGVGTSGAGDYCQVLQKIEDVRRLAGRTVTLSFLAHASSGTPKLGFGPAQAFGAGGSPSATVVVPGQSVTLSTTVTRFSATFVMPSISGKTLGTTAGSDYTQLSFFLSSGTTNAVQAGTPGVQSYTLILSDVQLEDGPVASPIEKIDIRYDLANCQRFYQTPTVLGGAYGVATAQVYVAAQLPVTMRTNPTLAITTNGNANLTGTAVAGTTNYVYYNGGTITATGGYTVNMNLTASADL